MDITSARDEIDAESGEDYWLTMPYVATALNYVRRRDLECDDIELLWIEIMPPRCASFLVGFVYKSPKTISRIDRCIASNIENALCLGSGHLHVGRF